MSDWKTLGKEKAASVNALIPKLWLLTSPLPSVEQQRDVTGKYIQKFLSSEEIDITETDAVGIVQKTTSGTWKARRVAEAFCHRAALAHQMVWIICISLCPILFRRALNVSSTNCFIVSENRNVFPV